jgi:hypothetical protein
LKNRTNQIAAVQITARRNLEVAALVAGRMHLSFGSKHRLYGKRPTSPWLPLPVVVVGDPGTDGTCTYQSRMRIAASMYSACRSESERQRQMSIQSKASPSLRIPATAWAAFAIQRATQS